MSSSKRWRASTAETLYFTQRVPRMVCGACLPQGARRVPVLGLERCGRGRRGVTQDGVMSPHRWQESHTCGAGKRPQAKRRARGLSTNSSPRRLRPCSRSPETQNVSSGTRQTTWTPTWCSWRIFARRPARISTVHRPHPTKTRLACAESERTIRPGWFERASSRGRKPGLFAR